ncbi:MAG: PSD1 and planctomycete cytochrome C domain-containing protein [Deltaproteobacteria bacterium]|nr:PSD1 and planctomycete cytochrome C domain-containing protein [Deltaproteobacteria bacterium]
MLLATALSAPFTTSAWAHPSDSEIQFNRDIRPILSSRCFYCHGPDKAKRKSGLRLDLREAAIEDKAIVAGRPDESGLYARIMATEPDEVMPPPESHKTLSKGEIDLLRRWIQSGAEYQPHWSYAPVKKTAVPPSEGTLGAGIGAGTRAETAQAAPTTAIDKFVSRELRERGMVPSPRAGKRTLLRRLSLDLTGLPPTLNELDAFAADERPDAYKRQVERLLASPHYGERMAVPWLDLVRFADTVGYHGDQNQNIFPYRDYVIESFNRNKPFDRFTIEQIAGDLLPGATEEQKIASGFNRLNMVTREGGAQPKEYLAKYMADRVRAVGTVWLGSTTGCAQCHDHKFDPFTQRDFYAMGAFFADLKEWGVYTDYEYTPNPELKGFTNDSPFPPEIKIHSAVLQRLSTSLRAQEQAWRREAYQQILQHHLKARNEWMRGVRGWMATSRDGWQPVLPNEVLSEDPTVENSIDGETVIFKSKKNAGPFEFPVSTLHFTVPPGSPLRSLASVRLQVVPHASHQGGTWRNERETVLLWLDVRIKRKGAKISGDLIGIANADADHRAKRYVSGTLQNDVVNGWSLSPAFRRVLQTSVWDLKVPQDLDPGDEVVVRIRSDGVGAVRLAVSPIATLSGDAPAGWAAGGAPWVRKLKAGMSSDRGASALFLASTNILPRLRRLILNERRQWLSIANATAYSLVSVATTPRETRVLPRGDWQNENGEVVQPGTPNFLPQIADVGKRRLTRLDLARWLVSRDNPLTSRAFMNRLWKQFFGTGLSAALDDLGGQGEPPTHPELLDWLAAEFTDSGWDVKHMVRLLVMSATYQQDSQARPELMKKDPQNRYLARQSQRRLDAEFLRDNVLKVAGLLNEDIGGPSVHPYQPAGYYENIEFPKREYVSEQDDRVYKRGVYMHWQRTFLHPMAANFDAPSREECVADRPISNTPQQALTLLNDPTFVEAARVFSERNLKQTPGLKDEKRLGRAFATALGRAPSALESRQLLKLLDEERSRFGAAPEDAEALLGIGQHPRDPKLSACEVAAWTSVSRVILNLYDAITRV